jgi:UDP-N-acetylmuramate--alanine ligase
METIYFIGIGGIGMSALARYYKQQGAEVHGYDKTPSPLTEQLEAEGMILHFEEDVTKIPAQVDMVVYTPAVPRTHKELVWFIEKGYPVKKRAEVLGIISRERPTVAVAGTHGKTTTSAILTHLLHTGGIDCTAFLGGIAANFGGNFVKGNSNWVVVEADEFDRSFLQLSPNIEIVTSMDADHLDIYGDRATFEKGFHDFIKRIADDGKVFYRHGLVFSFGENEQKYVDLLQNSSFGLGEGDIQATNIRVDDGIFLFDYQDSKGKIQGIRFTLPGHHNVLNATAAIAVARCLGVADTDIKTALATFKGIQRRFERIVQTKRHIYIDDYAHHPSELRAAIHAARTLYSGKKLTGIFQPHLYTRTRDFAEGFADALSGLDAVLLMDIYPARELPIEGVSAKMVFDNIKIANKKLVTKDNLLENIELSNVEVLLSLGAGDIDRFVPKIKQIIEAFDKGTSEQKKMK